MTPSRRALVAVPVAIGAVALAGCSLADDGPRTAQTRDVAAFTRIDNRDSVDVRLRVGDRQRPLRVRAGENVIDDVHTEVHDGTLKITFDHHGIGPSDVVVEASVPELTGVDASGSGDVDAQGIDADAFDVRSDGSSNIALAGTVGRLSLDVDGSGDADLADLAAREARVTVGGSGDVDVRADKRLDVAVDGSGDVRYHGRPALTRRVDGSGELGPAD
jgi:hypothetical protein